MSKVNERRIHTTNDSFGVLIKRGKKNSRVLFDEEIDHVLIPNNTYEILGDERVDSLENKGFDLSAHLELKDNLDCSANVNIDRI